MPIGVCSGWESESLNRHADLTCAGIVQGPHSVPPAAAFAFRWNCADSTPRASLCSRQMNYCTSLLSSGWALRLCTPRLCAGAGRALCGCFCSRLQSERCDRTRKFGIGRIPLLIAARGWSLSSHCAVQGSSPQRAALASAGLCLLGIAMQSRIRENMCIVNSWAVHIPQAVRAFIRRRVPLQPMHCNGYMSRIIMRRSRSQPSRPITFSAHIPNHF
jgi:hypothetical protein